MPAIRESSSAAPVSVRSPRGGGRRGRASASPVKDLFWTRLAWLALAGVWAFVVASMVSHSPADPPGHAAAYRVVAGPVGGATRAMYDNWCGPVGAFVSHHLFLLVGTGAWFLAAAGAFFLMVAARGERVGQPALRTIGCALVAVAISGYHALLMPGLSASPEGAGGLVAILGVHELQTRFGVVGTSLWLGLVLAVGAMVAFDRWLGFISAGLAGLARALWPKGAGGRVGHSLRAIVMAPARLARAAAGLFARPVPAVGALRPNDVDDDKPAVIVAERTRRKPAPPELEIELSDDATDEADEGATEAPPARPTPSRSRAEVAVAAAAAQPANTPDAEEDDEEAEEAGGAGGADGASKTFDPDELRAKMAMLPLRFAAAERRAATQEDLESIRALNADPEMSDYRFPPIDILEDPEENYSEKMEGFVREQAAALAEALRVYRIEGEVVGIESGPVITQYEVRLAPGTKVSQITAVASDLARSLKVVNVRIVPNTEGRDTVGIEAPNIQKERVRLKELMTSNEKADRMKLPLFLGKDAAGEPLVYDLADMPHILIAGTTGSGKSVAMNAIIVGFLYTKKPSDLKLVLVDPKMVEMSQFKDIPHLMCPVITDMNKAAAILEWAVTKMDERYELLSEAGCRDIDSYNATPWEEIKERMSPATPAEEARIPRKLPRMVFVIDELADLMMTNKEVETSIVRIAQKARAVGIHLILATQRPQANVVTGLIKSNMPSRLCFKVSSGMDSRIVMDQKGGELLLGQGDMLFLSPKSHKLVRAQGTLVEDAEIRKVVRFMRDVASPSFERSLVQIRPGDEEGKSWQEHAQEDELFDKAVDIILETGRGSVSLLQRRLAIGYTRASRLVDLMGMAGIIGEHKGSVAREVMISPEEWAAMKDQALKDAAETGRAQPAAPAPAQLAQRLFEEPPALAEEEDDEFTAEDVEPVALSPGAPGAFAAPASGESRASPAEDDLDDDATDEADDDADADDGADADEVDDADAEAEADVVEDTADEDAEPEYDEDGALIIRRSAVRVEVKPRAGEAPPFEPTRG